MKASGGDLSIRQTSNIHCRMLTAYRRRSRAADSDSEVWNCDLV